jgi:alpha-glucosidase (family GH31 glycosyl hydrolase)
MRFCALLFLIAPLAGAAAVVSHSRDVNRITLKLSDGQAVLEWLSPSSFRYRRWWAKAPAELPEPQRTAVSLEAADLPETISFGTRYLIVRLRKDNTALAVSKLDGDLLLSETTPPEKRDDMITMERAAAPGVRYYGLGARDDEKLDARGTRVEATTPFLLTTAGYAEYHVARGLYTFDLAHSKPDRYRIEIRDSPTVDYYFYYGPAPKEIYEEHLAAGRTVISTGKPFKTLRERIHASVSGIAPPEADASWQAYGPGDWFFGAYEEEARNQGYPILRAMPFQFPADAEVADTTAQFMLGDELLVATGTKAILPKGTWTDLRTNEQIPGRRTLMLKNSPAVFARNGTIVPLGSDPLALHYFPKLGAEFFLLERESGEWTQVHAAPAADLMRLEIESKQAREYEWVIHHIDRPKRVFFGDRDFPDWAYDYNRQVFRLRVRVATGQDHIVNLAF